MDEAKVTKIYKVVAPIFEQFAKELSLALAELFPSSSFTPFVRDTGSPSSKHIALGQDGKKYPYKHLAVLKIDYERYQAFKDHVYQHSSKDEHGKYSVYITWKGQPLYQWWVYADDLQLLRRIIDTSPVTVEVISIE